MIIPDRKRDLFTMPPIRLPATWMRGGTSKGLFFDPADLPTDPARRDALLLRVLGSPDPYGTQIDGLGGATSSTSKVALVSRSTRPGFDVDYRFGAVAVGEPVIDWSGNCGNLSAAVGVFALCRGLVAAPGDGVAAIRIWQANLNEAIVAHIPIRGGQPVEDGGFTLAGVAFPGAEIALDFLDPGGATALLPSGRPLDRLTVPGLGEIESTLLNAGNPTVFVRAAALGLSGCETRADFDRDAALLVRCEAIRAQGAVAMGLAVSAEDATARRPHTPKLAFVAPARDYRASDGAPVAAADIDLVARILSMGALHHAFTGTGAVALAVASILPGTLVHQLLGGRLISGDEVRIGHAAGVMAVGASVVEEDNRWRVEKAVLRRSARRLMEGWVLVPDSALVPPENHPNHVQ
jgi:probable AcnD-accessory protein PrpF